MEQTIGFDACAEPGWFRFWFADQRWEWSDELAAMYGYKPGEVTPTTELLLSHKHPDDREHVAGCIAAAAETGQPFYGRQRIIDRTGEVREVIVVGDLIFDEDGTIVGTSGYYVDVSDRLEEQRQEVLEEVLPEVIEARAVIEQAKGALILAYGVNAEQAFRVLRWRSQETNTKLRDLAAQFVAELRMLSKDSAGFRNRFDHLLLTVHERVDAS
ncbi:PAS domain S-box-containing protein [Nocardia tenerifensis]|uniref:histidine kinase n=1 Tax=Nocardia tenerifensis TaxID=228006 RepID=A0A318JYE1_9NOCA|nr:PAS and ANTAR domain-containing protein [Nocardia tenerifensis]PXX59737.1 PAS domain S-box-containing protein [Nocardia tenerifensis]